VGNVFCVAGVDRELKNGTGEHLVCLGSHDHAKVTMAAAAACRGNGAGISKDLLIINVTMVLVGVPTMAVSVGWGKAKLDVGMAMFEFCGSNTKAEQWVLRHLFDEQLELE